MTSPDLPVELWLEILAYLPRSALHRMLGINRTLFELALNDIYNEIRLVNDDKEMVKTLKQLRHPNIADRVHRLYIRPAFLPGMDEECQAPVTPPLSKLDAGISFLKNVFQRQKLGLPATAPISANTPISDQLFMLASKAIRACVNLKRLSIVVYDHALSPAFMEFLDSLYQSNSLGPKLMHLSIDTTVTKLPSLLKPLMVRSSSLTSLENFAITLSNSRFGQTKAEYADTCQALTSFYTTFSKTLDSVSISMPVILELKGVFDAFPAALEPKSLHLLAIFNAQTLPRSEDLTKFLASRSNSLEHLTLSAHPQQTSFHASEGRYEEWMNDSDTTKSSGFGELTFPELRSLEIELFSPITYYYHNDTPDPLPPLCNITPNLRSLILTHRYLTFAQFLKVIDGLPTFELDKTRLERFEFRISYLCPQIFDILSEKAPRLLSLSIDFMTVGASSISESDSLSRQYSLNWSNNEAFKNAMGARKYPDWRLSKLRLADTGYSSAHPHPNVPYMKLVAGTLSQEIILLADSPCECRVY